MVDVIVIDGGSPPVFIETPRDSVFEVQDGPQPVVTVVDVVSVYSDETVAPALVVVSEPQFVLESREKHTVITEGTQGPPGAGGETTMSRRTDFVSDTMLYKAKAAPGSADSDSVWQIVRVVVEAGQADERLANGSGTFNQAWTDRAILTYL